MAVEREMCVVVESKTEYCYIHPTTIQFPSYHEINTLATKYHMTCSVSIHSVIISTKTYNYYNYTMYYTVALGLIL